MWICNIIIVFVWLAHMQLEIHACEYWGNLKHNLIFICTPSVNDIEVTAISALSRLHHNLIEIMLRVKLNWISHTHTCTYMQTHTHACTHTCTYTCMHTRACTHTTHAHTHTCMHTHMHAHTYACTHNPFNLVVFNPYELRIYVSYFCTVHITQNMGGRKCGKVSIAF